MKDFLKICFHKTRRWVISFHAMNNNINVVTKFPSLHAAVLARSAELTLK